MRWAHISAIRHWILTSCFIHWGFMSTDISCPTSFPAVSNRERPLVVLLSKNPDILLCDEPTGALDYNTSKEILRLIEQVNQKYGNTIIMVTHNDAIKNMADRVVKLRDGQIRKNYLNESKVAADDLDW